MPEQFNREERFRREKLWKAKRQANIPEPWNVNTEYLERVQRKTYELAIKDAIEVMKGELAERYGEATILAPMLEEIFQERGILLPKGTA